MKIHEYQAKELLRRYGIPTPRGEVVGGAREAAEAARRLGAGPWAVKAQVHAGGRGKGGGIRLARTPEEVGSSARAILAKPLVTPQTGPGGRIVRKLLVEEGCRTARELYLAAVLDRATATVALMASPEGGTDIEEVAAARPEKIFTVHVEPGVGFAPYHARTLAYELGLEKSLHGSFGKIVEGLVRLYLEKDCSLAEINPLIVTEDGRPVALDAKVAFDENALYRQTELAALHDPNEEDPRDIEAAKWKLNYIRLDGNIGCMVNGAGLAMSTMDIIKLQGGEPANFLDVGGGASTEMVREAFKLLASDANVRAILVNIFGGIMRCDVLAEGIVEAVRQVGLNVPLVVRLEGTNVGGGRKILLDAKLDIRTAADMTEAAALAVAAARGA